MLIYLSGPYTYPDPVYNTHLAIKEADRVLALGHTPLIPHLNLVWQMASPKPYDEWLQIDLEIMSHCDVVYRFGGESHGADVEVREAVEIGLPVIYSLDKLADYVV